MTSIWDRSATAASNTSTPPAGFPENQNASLVDDQFRAEMAYETEFVHSIVVGGTADALTVTYTNIPASLTDGMEIHVRAAAANATTTPTLNVNSLGAKTITKAGGTALVAGDIAGNLHELTLRYNVANTRWELLNPASGIRGPASSTANDIPKFSDTSGKVLSDGYTVGTSANNLVQLNGSAQLPALSGALLTGIPAQALSLTILTNSLSADVALNNTSNYFDGPSVAQGTSGTWFVSGTVSVNPASADGFAVKLWDGTTVISSAFVNATAINNGYAVSLSGVITNPAGNIRISVKDVTSTTGSIKFNSSGNSKDSTITAVRIG